MNSVTIGNKKYTLNYYEDDDRLDIWLETSLGKWVFVPEKSEDVCAYSFSKGVIELDKFTICLYDNEAIIRDNKKGVDIFGQFTIWPPR